MMSNPTSLRFQLLCISLSIALAPLASAQADDSRSFEAVHTAAQRVLEPLNHEFLGKPQFNLDPLQSDLANLNASAQNPECDPKCADKDPNCKKPARQGWITATVEGNVQALGPALKSKSPYSSYKEPVLRFNTNPNACQGLSDAEALQMGCAAPIYSDMIDYYRRVTGFTRADIQAMSTQQLIDAVSAFEVSYYQVPLTEDSNVKLKESIARQAAAYKLYSATSETEWRGIARSLKDWSPEQKKQLISLMGRDFAQRYDYSRLSRRNASYKGSVDVLQLFKGQRDGSAAGVCRDIASGMGQVAEEMGMKDVYIVGFTAQGGHATLMARDPSDPKKIVKFNYGDSATADMSTGTNALTQEHDLSTMYYVAKPAGGVVSVLPSEFQNALTSATGSDVTEFDLFSRDTSPAMVTLQAGNGRLQGHLFAGVMSNGSKIVGIAPTAEWGSPEGVAGGKVTLAGVFQKDDAVKINAGHAYLQYVQYLNSPWMHLGAGTQARLKSTTVANGDLVQSSMGGRTPEVGVGGVAVSTVAGEVRHVSADEKTSVKAEAGAQFGVGMPDIRDATRINVFRNMTFVKVEGTQQLTKDVEGLLKVALGAREFGPQIMIQSGVTNKDGTRAVTAGYEGALKSDSPTIAPGTVRSVYAGVSTTLNRWTLSAEIRQNLQQEKKKPEIRAKVKKTL